MRDERDERNKTDVINIGDRSVRVEKNDTNVRDD